MKYIELFNKLLPIIETFVNMGSLTHTHVRWYHIYTNYNKVGGSIESYCKQEQISHQTFYRARTLMNKEVPEKFLKKINENPNCIII